MRGYDPHVHDEKLVIAADIGGRPVEVVYVEWKGGGISYEFYAITEEGDDLVLHKSDLGYGGPTPCLIDAYIFQLIGSVPSFDDPEDPPYVEVIR